jgi:hypothetical protein
MLINARFVSLCRCELVKTLHSESRCTSMDARKPVLESAIALGLFTGFYCSAALRLSSEVGLWRVSGLAKTMVLLLEARVMSRLEVSLCGLFQSEH